MEGNEEAELSGLFRAALVGDEAAYAQFLRRAAELVRVFARSRITQGGVDPEDVVQETLLALHMKRHTWRTEAPVLPWLYAIARFKLIDGFRRTGRRKEVVLDEASDTAAETPEEQPSEREIARALDALPEGQKAVVSSISVQGRTISDTAVALGMTEGAVRVALHRGLMAIARRFGRD